MARRDRQQAIPDREGLARSILEVEDAGEVTHLHREVLEEVQAAVMSTSEGQVDRLAQDHSQGSEVHPRIVTG
jgi:hypothetical protein